jgi:nicotinate-nucleotide adenylyltransferase
MRLGIFGGTFDPPHLAHLILAAEAHCQLALDRVLWVLTPDPPHKQGRAISGLEDRLELLQAALEGDPAFALSRVDIDRSPPHYSLDTVLALRDQHPQAVLVFLMGGDSLHDLPAWHRPHDLIAACDEIGVMRRPGDGVDMSRVKGQFPEILPKLRFVDAPLLEISASEIRRRAAAGLPYRYFLPPAVYELVRAKGLYRGTRRDAEGA